jgi:hypothetical protein
MNTHVVEVISKITRKNRKDQTQRAAPHWKCVKPPPLSIAQVLAWADAHRSRTGWWPTVSSGPVHEAPTENWRAIVYALKKGFRGLPAGSSLPRLLRQARGARYHRDLPEPGIRQILQWADAHYNRYGRWPNSRSGAIPNSGAETWQRVYQCLRRQWGPKGRRSLPQLLTAQRVRRGSRKPGNLSIDQILSWADAYFAKKGRWPGTQSGGIPEARGMSWREVNYVLRRGQRGLPKHKSLDRLLEASGRGSSNCTIAACSSIKRSRRAEAMQSVILPAAGHDTPPAKAKRKRVNGLPPSPALGVSVPGGRKQYKRGRVHRFGL